MHKLILSALLVSLAGCATSNLAERSAQMENEVAEMIQVYGPACEKLGFQPDSDAWRDCILKLNTSKTVEKYNSRPTMNQCWGHRGFYQCSFF